MRRLRFRSLGLGACEPHLLGKLADCEAKLNHRFQLTGVHAVLFSVRRCVELEKPEFDCAFGKGCVEVGHVVAAIVVVVFLPDAHPDSRTRHPQGLPWSWLLFVDLLQNLGSTVRQYRSGRLGLL